jgi:hypothetical protein
MRSPAHNDDPTRTQEDASRYKSTLLAERTPPFNSR